MVKKKVNTEPTGGKPDEGLSRGFICRLDFVNTQRMEEYLANNRCSFSDFVKDALEREALKKEKMVIIKTSKSNKVNPAIEESSTSFEEVHQIARNQVFDFRLCPLYCPKCDDQKMYEYLGKEIRSTVAKSWVIIWKCPKCGYSFDTYQPIFCKSKKTNRNQTKAEVSYGQEK